MARVKKPAIPAAPSTLGADGRALWETLHAEYEFSEAKQIVLQHACEALDRKRQAQRDIAKHGILIETGGLIRQNPATKTEVENGRLFLAYLRELHLDLEPLHDGPGRPAGS